MRGVARDRRGLHRLRLRDHAAHRARHGAGRRRRDPFCEPIGHVQVNGDYVESGSRSRCRRSRSRSRATSRRKVTAELGGRGIFGVELFVKGDEVWFSEVSPRPHDTGMVTMCTQTQSEFDLHARAILGLPVDTRLACARRVGGDLRRHRRARACLRRRGGRLARARFRPAPLRQAGGVQERRMGVALARGRDIDEARARAKECASAGQPSRLTRNVGVRPTSSCRPRW